MTEHHADDPAHGGGEHSVDQQALGPIDIAAWGASLLGVAAGLLVCLMLYLAVS